MSRPSRVWAAVIALVLVGAAVGSQRWLLGVESGGRGQLPLLGLLTLVLAAGTALRFHRAVFGALAHPAFLAGWSPYLVLALILPMLGVLALGYPERTLLSLLEPAMAVAGMVLGAAVVAARGRRGAPFGGALVLAALAQMLYALAQALHLSGALQGSPWTLVREWDVAAQAAHGPIVLGRSTGLYVNPNILGLWSAITIVYGLTALAGRSRYVCLAAGSATLLLSQSRGALVALLVAVAFLAVASEGGRHAIRGVTTRLLPFTVGAALGVGLIGALISAGYLDPAALGRILSGMQLLAGERGTDPSLTGRIDLWEAGMRLTEEYPLGTLGPPELLLGAGLDSSWVRAFIQGGPLYAGAMALMLLSGAMRRAAGVPEIQLLRGLSVLVAAAAVTQTPLSYPPIIVFWAAVGAALVRMPERDRAMTPLPMPGRFSPRPPPAAPRAIVPHQAGRGRP